MIRGFEWLVAWRYLRDRDRVNLNLLFIGLALAAVGVVLMYLASGLPTPDPEAVNAKLRQPTPEMRYGRYVFIGGAVCAVLGLWVTIFGACLAAFRLFTTISIFGVFFGTQALIIVLAVMSGFEGNLRKSILGNNAHVIIKRGHKPFKDDPKIRARLFDAKGRPRIRGVVAATTFLKDEVILSGPKAHAGVYLKGINPRNPIARQLVGKNVHIGTIDNLIYPQRLAYLSPLVVPVTGRSKDDDDQDDKGGARPKPRPPPMRPAPPVMGPGPTKKGWPTPATQAATRKPAHRAKVEEPTAKPMDTPADHAERVAMDPADPPEKPARHPGRPQFIHPEVLPGIIIGKELAKTLGLRLGDQVDVISTKTQDIIITGPMPRLKGFRVAGIFFSGHYEYDQKYAYVDLQVAQKFLRKQGMISGFEIHTRSPDQAVQVAARLQQAIGPASGYRAEPWQKIHKAIFAALEAEKIAMFLVLVVIVLVASFSIVANLIMVVLEKSAEISVLRSMGASQLSILKIFALKGVYIGVIGMILGIGVGLAASLYLRYFGLSLDPEVYYISSLPVAVNIWEIVIVAGSVIAISLLAALFPAVRAMRLQPVEGLRYK